MRQRVHPLRAHATAGGADAENYCGNSSVSPSLTGPCASITKP